MLRANGLTIAGDLRGRITSQAATARERVNAIPLADRLAAGAALVVAALLDFVRLGQNGDGNLYYAAAVRSMLESWHNFFFVSFDPGGFVSIDKPPVDFWIQAASAKLFGVSGFSLALPQALAGIASVGVLYLLVRRVFGVLPAFLAALALAITPIDVAANRDNIVDSMLVLVVLLAAWAVLRAAESGQLRWLLLGAALVGLGFNVKMMEAYLVVPALGVLYALAAPGSRRTRAAHLALGAAVLLVISLSWATAVDLTPASQRPYVGSSSTNSELNLAFGYNGIDRLIGGLFGRRGGGGARATAPSTTGATTAPSSTAAATSAAARARAQGFGGLGETGGPGPLRLFNTALGSQVSWLLALALLGLLASAWGVSFRRVLAVPQGWISAAARAPSKLIAFRAWFAGGATANGRPRLTPQQQTWTLWGMWLITMAAFFSVAGFFHAYYMVMMAPAICVLAGVGAVALWRDYQHPGWRGWLLPLAVALTALTQLGFLNGAPASLGWVAPLIALGAFGAAALLVAVRLAHQTHDVEHARATATTDAPIERVRQAWVKVAPRLRWAAPRAGIVAAVGMAALLLGPTVWAAATVATPGNEMAPTAGPHAVGAGGGFGGEVSTVDPKLVQYLTAHQGNARFLFATLNATSAAPYVLETGKPIMAIGGFMGGDQILTLPDLQHLVSTGQVRYFLLSAGGRGFGFSLTPEMISQLPAQFREMLESRGGLGGFGGFNANASLTSWVSGHCAVVPSSQWSSTRTGATSTPGSGQPGPSSTGRGGYGGFPSGRGGMGTTLYDCAGK